MDYKKKYEEALERARKLATDLPNGRNDRLYHVWDLEQIFPELKESEDERIIKSFIRLLKAFYDVNFPTPEGFERKDMLAWLEKQGAELSVYQNVLFKIATILSQHEDKEDSPLEQIRSIVVDGLVSAMDIDKQGEQKPEEIVNLHEKLKKLREE